MYSFEKIAPFLTNPLVLVGFVIFGFYGLLRVIVKAGIIPPVAQTTGGQILKSFLRYGFIIAIVTITLGFLIEAYKTFVGAQAVTNTLDRALNPLTLAVTFTMTVPLTAPEMSGYLTRLQNMTNELVDDYKRLALPASANSAALGTELTRKQHAFVRTAISDDAGHLLPTSFSLAPDSPLLPDKENEKFTWSVFHDLSLALFIYKKHIAPQEFKNIFSIGHPSSDIGAWVLSPNPTSYEYSIGSSVMIISFSRLPLPRDQFVENSGTILAAKDLRGTQIFIYPNNGRPALEGRDESSISDLLHSISLDSVEIVTGAGAHDLISVPVKTLQTVTSEWSDPIYIYIVPPLG